MKRVCVAVALLCLAGCDKSNPNSPTCETETIVGADSRGIDIRMSSLPGETTEYIGRYRHSGCGGNGCGKPSTIHEVFLDLRTTAACPADYKVVFRPPSGVQRVIWDFEGDCGRGMSQPERVLLPRFSVPGVKGEPAVGFYDFFLTRSDKNIPASQWAGQMIVHITSSYVLYGTC